jgi:uncharacterized LabA/DUF88 family protein
LKPIFALDFLKVCADTSSQAAKRDCSGASGAKEIGWEALAPPIRLFGKEISVNKRVCVFVDGENFRHSMADLFPTIYRNEDYLPKDAIWGDFFEWLTKAAISFPVERIRTYWYVVQDVDFHPNNLPFANDDNLNEVHRILIKDEKIRQELSGLTKEQLKPRVIDTCKRIRERQDVFKKRFDGWKKVHQAIEYKCDAIEFRKAGAIRYDCFTKTLGNEKAVDVKLATDMLVLKDIYDLAIIVSGDQDYVPAVQIIKDSGKRVVNIAFKGKDGRILPGGARRLNQRTDWSFDVPYEDAKRFLFPDPVQP